MKRNTVIIIVLALVVAGICWSKYRTLSDMGTTTPSEASKAPPFRKDSELKLQHSTDTAHYKLVDIEIADEEWEITRGLMFRTQMSDSQGMLFIFDQDAPRNFWMKNTRISLDIIYINSNKEIVSIAPYTTPYSEELVPSELPAQYVLEVIGGFAEKFDVKVGDKVMF